MTLADIEPGAYLYLEEELQILEFVSWERDGQARVVWENGREGVYDVRGTGYTFHIVPDEEVETLRTTLTVLRTHLKSLKLWVSENTKPL